MFGRIRASPSPAEWLEMEVPPPKLFKDDSLSIYEATLLKLKQGSQQCLSSKHNVSSASQDPMDLETNADISEESPRISDSCSSEISTSGILSSPDQGRKKGREVPIHVLFSRYNNSHGRRGFSCSNNGMIVKNQSLSSCSVSSYDSDSTAS